MMLRIDKFNLPGIVAALATAWKTGLLNLVIENPEHSAETYSHMLACSEVATSLILSLLTEMGILIELGGHYKPSPEMAELDALLPNGLTGDMQLWSEMFDFMKNGAMPRKQTEANSGEVYSKKAFAVEKLYKAPAEELGLKLVRQYPMPRVIMDIGAGSGVWSLAMEYTDRLIFVDQKPVIEQLRKRVVELDTDITVAREVKFVTADFRTLDYVDMVDSPVADRLVLANILHLEKDPFPYLKNWVQFLNPDGNVVVIDNFGIDKIGIKLYEIHLAMRSAKAVNHKLSQIREWFHELGFMMKTLYTLQDPETLGAAVFTRF